MADLSSRDRDIMKLEKVIHSLRSERKNLLSSNPTLQNDNVQKFHIAIDDIVTYLTNERIKKPVPIARINAAIEQVCSYKNLKSK